MCSVISHDSSNFFLGFLAFLNFTCLILLKEFQLKKVEGRNVVIKLEQFQVGYYATPSILIIVNTYSP